MPPLYHTPSLFDGKVCSACHLWSLFSNYYVSKSAKDRFASSCKPCERERSRLSMQRGRDLHPGRNQSACRRHYLKYQERYLALATVYRGSHRDEIRHHARQYHHTHKIKANDGRKSRYRAGNEWQKLREIRAGQRDEINARARAYRKQKPLTYRAYDQAKQAKRKNAPGHHTAEDERLQYLEQGGLCYWCNDTVGNVFHIDHIQPLSRGGSNNPDNICIACPYCNLHKWCLTPEEWLKRLSKSRPLSTANMNTLRLSL
jgi:hypothetical protein